jgi:hypothetical protein
MKNNIVLIKINWYSKFLIRYTEIKIIFSRIMNRQRIKIENPDEFIE